MLQPSQVPAYIRFLTVIVAMIVFFEVVFGWALRKKINDMQESPDYSEQDIISIRRQMLALMIGVPVFLLFLVLSPLGWNLHTRFIDYLALIIGFAPLAYISVSSIQNRVSMFQGSKSLPVKGSKAVWNGIFYLVFILLIFTAISVYFASIQGV